MIEIILKKSFQFQKKPYIQNKGKYGMYIYESILVLNKMDERILEDLF